MVNWNEENKKCSHHYDFIYKGEEEMYPQLTKELNPGEILVEMKTTMGSMKIKLFPEHAPKAVENFRSCKVRLL